jgi:hypothetical protein
MHLTIPGHLRGALLILLLGGCLGGSTPPAEPTPGSGSGSGSGTAAVVPGGAGTICHAGLRHPPGEPPPEVHPCAPGLQCCYPCGIEGCDSVCMADCGPPRP